MPEFSFEVAIQYRLLSNQLLLADPLLFPEIACLDDSPRRLRRMLVRRLVDEVKGLEPGDIHQRWPTVAPTAGRFLLTIPPVANDTLRRRPVRLRVPYSQWRHHSGTWVASVPALGIDVIADDEATLLAQLEPQTRAALSRRKIPGSLLALALLAEERRMRVKPLALRVNRPTLKEAAIKCRADRKSDKSVLEEVSVDLSKSSGHPLFERDALVSQLARRLTGPGLQSVLLVGPSGVGKSAIVHELARRAVEFGLAGSTIWSTRGSSLVAGMTGCGMWQQRCQDLVTEARQTQAVVHLHNLIELREVGKGGGNTTGVAAMLRPSLMRGDLRAIAECTPEQLALIERDEPQLIESFTVLNVDPPTESATREILRRFAIHESARRSPAATLSAAALDELDRLHRRYATYSAAPGRQLRFLSNLLEDCREPRELTPVDVVTAFSHETGLPLFMLDDQTPLDLQRTRDWFTARILGQPEPINLVADLLAAVKSGLTRRGKPIAGLLFIGPTGVGKTETARALAEFLYRDPDRMIRIDMSEYADIAAVDRLIGGSCSTPGLLTQKVRDQPFMVVLLDEFEKGHPRLFDLLLQVLGEGRLTDAGGRLADFTNTVVIMTSNLGAESFRGGGFGFQTGDASERSIAAGQHFQREVQRFLRPELFNRIDQIVPFAPLSRDSIREIGRREIMKLTGRIGLKSRQVRFEVTPEALDRLTENGYDPRYGARPLKREIERRLTAVLAERLCRSTGNDPLECRVDVVARELSVTVHAVSTKGGPPGTAGVAVRDELLKVSQLRRRVQRVETSGAVLRLRNEVEMARLAKAARERRAKRRGITLKYQFGKEEQKLIAIERLIGDVDALSRDVVEMEQTWLDAWYAGERLDSAELSAWHALCHDQMIQVLRRVLRVRDEQPGIVTLYLFSADREFLSTLAEAYLEIARDGGARPGLFWLQRPDPRQSPAKSPELPDDTPATVPQPAARLTAALATGEAPPARLLLEAWNKTPEEFLPVEESAVGAALAVSSADAISLLGHEAGRHVLIDCNSRRYDCVVEVSSGLLSGYHPPDNVGREGSFAQVENRRKYDLYEGACHDARLTAELEMSASTFIETVRRSAELALTENALELLD